jgi:hypothetical protein
MARVERDPVRQDRRRMGPFLVGETSSDETIGGDLQTVCDPT